MFKVFGQVLLDDLAHGLLNFGAGTKELTPRDLDGTSLFLQRHPLPELGLGAQLYGALVIPALAVLFATEGAGSLVVFVPEEGLHAVCHLDLASLVVDGGVWQRREEADAVVCRAALDAATQRPAVNQDVTARACRRAATLPCLGKECLALEVLVKLVAQLHGDVAQDPFDDDIYIWIAHGHSH